MNPPEKLTRKHDSLVFVGDVHANFTKLIQIAHRFRDSKIVQVGDMGIGFTNNPNPKFPDNVKFIRGNHDNPALCRESRSYLGDFGYDPAYGIFWLGGAWSIDARSRIEGRDWWRDEELTTSQLWAAFELYAKTHPRIVVTHDCPKFLYDQICSHHSKWEGNNYSTPEALQKMWEFHQPQFWFFGHHHKSFTSNEKGTRFTCLKELETCQFKL